MQVMLARVTQPVSYQAFQHFIAHARWEADRIRRRLLEIQLKIGSSQSQHHRGAVAAGTPSLIIRPWHQSASAVSLREFTNTAFNQHHGMQTTERFGVGTDVDGDGVVNELTRGDVTATVFQAALPVPGRVIPNDPGVERAVLIGERVFDDIRCTTCHVPSLPLERRGWVYSEPRPFSPPANRRRGDARVLAFDLTSAALPQPRLAPSHDDPSVVHVPAYTDFKTARHHRPCRRRGERATRHESAGRVAEVSGGKPEVPHAPVVGRRQSAHALPPRVIHDNAAGGDRACGRGAPATARFRGLASRSRTA
jgi:hypothetical protein